MDGLLRDFLFSLLKAGRRQIIERGLREMREMRDLRAAEGTSELRS